MIFIATMVVSPYCVADFRNNNDHHELFDRFASLF